MNKQTWGLLLFNSRYSIRMSFPAVWPDVGILGKVTQTFPKVAQREATSLFTLKAVF